VVLGNRSVFKICARHIGVGIEINARTLAVLSVTCGTRSPTFEQKDFLINYVPLCFLWLILRGSLLLFQLSSKRLLSFFHIRLVAGRID
jgi:hypothetical protein